ncbi:MAG: hypothetical protein NUV53_01180 [Patescibacteria group bacterium]|nr:hypothetical protein [Patescibacteria group bacterium]
METNENKFENLIRVNLSVRPVYPAWVKEVMHPHLEMTGLAEYYLRTLGRWLPTENYKGCSTSGSIYRELVQKALIKDCFGLADLLAIQKGDISLFRKFFAGKIVPGWKSAVTNKQGDLRFPCIAEHADGSTGAVTVELYWEIPNLVWRVSDTITPRFRKLTRVQARIAAFFRKFASW